MQKLKNKILNKRKHISILPIYLAIYIYAQNITLAANQYVGESPSLISTTAFKVAAVVFALLIAFALVAVLASEEKMKISDEDIKKAKNIKPSNYSSEDKEYAFENEESFYREKKDDDIIKISKKSEIEKNNKKEKYEDENKKDIKEQISKASEKTIVIELVEDVKAELHKKQERRKQLTEQLEQEKLNIQNANNDNNEKVEKNPNTEMEVKYIISETGELVETLVPKQNNENKENTKNNSKIQKLSLKEIVNKQNKKTGNKELEYVKEIKLEDKKERQEYKEKDEKAIPVLKIELDKTATTVIKDDVLNKQEKIAMSNANQNNIDANINLNNEEVLGTTQVAETEFQSASTPENDLTAMFLNNLNKLKGN